MIVEIFFGRSSMPTVTNVLQCNALPVTGKKLHWSIEWLLAIVQRRISTMWHNDVHVPCNVLWILSHTHLCTPLVILWTCYTGKGVLCGVVWFVSSMHSSYPGQLQWRWVEGGRRSFCFCKDEGGRTEVWPQLKTEVSSCSFRLWSISQKWVR